MRQGNLWLSQIFLVEFSKGIRGIKVIQNSFTLPRRSFKTTVGSKNYKNAFKRLISEEATNLFERIINLKLVKNYLLEIRQKAIARERLLLDQETLTDLEQEIISNISMQGYWQGNISSLLPEAVANDLLDKSQEVSQQLFRQLQQQNHNLGSTLALDPARISADTNNWIIYQAGLDERILKIVHHYIGLPIAYHGPEIRLSRAIIGKLDWTGPRVPHHDAEEGQSYPMVKAVLYLSDVTEDTGAFVVVKDGKNISLSGKQGTLILADTSLTLHHGMPLKHGKRLALFWTYTSRCPHYPHRCIIWPHSHLAVRKMTNSLSLVQRRVARWREALPMVLCPVKYHPLPCFNFLMRERNSLV